MAPFVAALIEAGRLQPGSAVLDVAAASSRDVRPEIEWHAAPADQLPFPDASFDVVLCQQGFQFFPDLGAAVAEAARVTGPGGRVAGTVWLPIDRSPYMWAQQRSIETVAGPQVGETFTAAFGRSAERPTGPSTPPGSARSSRARCSPTSACRRPPSSFPGT